MSGLPEPEMGPKRHQLGLIRIACYTVQRLEPAASLFEIQCLNLNSIVPFDEYSVLIRLMRNHASL